MIARIVLFVIATLLFVVALAALNPVPALALLGGVAFGGFGVLPIMGYWFEHHA